MELIFNELSFRPHLRNGILLKDKFLEMLHIFGELKDKFGLERLLIPKETFTYKVSAETTFIQWVSSLTNTSDKNKILSFIRTPFSEDILENDEQAETGKYYYENPEVDINQEYCVGLSICHAKDRVAISLHSHRCWEPYLVPLKKILDENFNTRNVEVFNVCNSGTRLAEDLSQKLQYYGKLELIETDIPPENKKVKLSGDHHGNDKLKVFARKLLRSKYVKEIINNIDFSPTTVNLIKEKYADGTIDIVLYWEDAGYGMKIQTTGRNYRETEAIAEIIRKEFDK
ncbi:hypothetical protein SAMN05216365_13742 [Porphyromonadaceae bacterium NLAE-zl-C104]|nr:hypothetical protein SAMN05216365_13742 [Porphyromonadaceae bacterium NLAE-zl-C104]